MLPSAEKNPVGSPIRTQLPSQVPQAPLCGREKCDRRGHSAPWLGKCYHCFQGDCHKGTERFSGLSYCF